MTEPTPLIDSTLLDADVEAPMLETEAPKYHTILEVWQSVLKPAGAVRASQITPQWSSRICGSYREMNFADMPTFRDRYFDKLQEILDVLQSVIEADDECLNLTTAAEDIEHNFDNYVHVLTEWQKTVLGWELDWDCTDPKAGPELAAIAEVHSMLFGDTGVSALLDNTPFEFTDLHRDALSLALQAFKAEKEGGGE